jgi:hypothetical protein
VNGECSYIARERVSIIHFSECHPLPVVFAKFKQLPGIDFRYCNIYIYIVWSDSGRGFVWFGDWIY